MNSTAAHLFARSLQEDLEKQRKTAFVPMGSPAEKTGQQASGPGGMPVDPMAAGGAPMDPMAGGAPMDPMAAGGMPMDPMAAGGMPMDPMAGGAPMDPMAGGMPPLPPEEELPPLPGEGAEEVIEGESSVTGPDAETMQSIQANTMDIVRQTLEMVGKAKPVEAGEAKEESAPAASEPSPETQPGPVTGLPQGAGGLDLGTTPKVASVLAIILKKHVASRLAE